MTPNEALTELQQTYDKALTDFQISRYLRFLGKFKPADIEKIIEKAIEESRYLPKIAQLNDAAKDLLILQPSQKKKPDKDCPVCSGTGWEYVTVIDKFFHQETQAVKPCGCKDDPGAQGPKQGVWV